MSGWPSQYSALNWRKSNRSGGNGACVEVACEGTPVLVRDSRDPSGVMLAFSAAQWSAFVRRTRKGEPTAG